MLTFNGVALHGIEQFCDVAFHTCGAGFFNNSSPTTYMDGAFRFFFAYCHFMYDFFLGSEGCAAEAKVAA